MKKKVVVTADSTCDLSKEIIEKYNITITSLYAIQGENILKDGVEIDQKGVFDYYNRTKQLTKTSAVNLADYEELFRELTGKGYEVVHISISSDMSSSFQNASIAAAEVEGVYVVDSRNLSSGSGHSVMIAAEMANEGKSGKEIFDFLSDVIPRVDASFIIDTLEYLYKGGRCSALSMLGANMLKLKPCIEVHDGAMGVYKKYKGAYSSCLTQYVSDRLSNIEGIEPKRIFITHTVEDHSLVEMVRKQVESYNYFGEIIETMAGSTIASHCGPNTLGVLYINK